MPTEWCWQIDRERGADVADYILDAATPVIVGTAGDDTITIDEGTDVEQGFVDGGEGYDTLRHGPGGISLANIRVENVEAVRSSWLWETSIEKANVFSYFNVDWLELTGPGGHVDVSNGYVGWLDATKLSSGLELVSDFTLAAEGTRFADTMSGGERGYSFFGRGGDDHIQVDVAGILQGGAGRDTLIGGVGNDTLNGGWGDDSMAGGTGDDRYAVDNRADIIVELADEGTDTVRSSVSYALGDNVENLVLIGAKWRWGDGNELDNTLTGNFNRNVLSGKDGDDTLDGRGGADTLWGGAGDDSFVISGPLNGRNVDTIKDFGNCNDVIVLSSSAFTALDVGALDGAAFEIGDGVAHSAEARILYNTATGALSYDADGSGSGAAVQFAMLKPNLNLTADDFVVI